MVTFGADENFNFLIIRGLKRRKPALDILPLQDVGLRTEDDPVTLDWAAEEGRVILTHDIPTMPSFAAQRSAEGQHMPGLVVVPDDMPIGHAIEDLLLIAECTEPEKWNGHIEYLPL